MGGLVEGGLDVSGRVEHREAGGELGGSLACGGAEGLGAKVEKAELFAFDGISAAERAVGFEVKAGGKFGCRRGRHGVSFLEKREKLNIRNREQGTEMP